MIRNERETITIDVENQNIILQLRERKIFYMHAHRKEEKEKDKKHLVIKIEYQVTRFTIISLGVKGKKVTIEDTQEKNITQGLELDLLNIGTSYPVSGVNVKNVSGGKKRVYVSQYSTCRPKQYYHNLELPLGFTEDEMNQCDHYKEDLCTKIKSLISK